MRYSVVLGALALVLAACGGGGGGSGGGKLTIYSGREEELIGPLIKRFEQQSGVPVEVRYGDSAELAATILEEGSNTPADVFFGQDPGSLGSLETGNLAERLPSELLGRVDSRFRDAEGYWVGTSGRSRVIAYNTAKLSEQEVPDSVFALTDPKWKGKLGIAPPNASFQAFVTAMRLTQGERKTRAWLQGIKANDPKLYEENLPIVKAVASGEILLGLVNHYYLPLVKAENPNAKVANHYLPGRDPGALVSVAGAAILRTTDNREAARKFVDFLLSREGQRFYVEEAEESEYPLVKGVPPKRGLPPLAKLQGPDIRLSELGPQLERTLKLLSEVGLTT